MLSKGRLKFNFQMCGQSWNSCLKGPASLFAGGNTYAIIETGGKQYKVQEGDVLFIEKIEAEDGATVTFDKVLAVSSEGSVTFGRPLVENANVTAKVLGQGRAKKIIVFKYKAKKGYRKKQGHRQPFTKVQIEKISV